MSLIQILNYSQKKEFETPPLLEYEIRQEIFSITNNQTTNRID